jgi:fatty acid desaturase
MATRSSILKAEEARRGFAPQDPNLDAAVRRLQSPSLAASLRAFALDWGVIACVGPASWWLFVRYGVTPLSVLIYLVAVLVIGSRQKGLENLMHEGTHMNLCPDRRMNDIIAVLLGGFWLAPQWRPERERPMHVAGHHNHFGDKAYDSEFFGYRDLGLGRLPTGFAWESLHIIGLAFLRTTWWRMHATLQTFRGIRGAIILGLAVGLYWVGALVPLVMYWFVPFLLVYMPMRFLAEVSEHMGLGQSTEFETTRNKLGWFQEYVMHPHGDGYHVVHHMYPRIPHQNLAKAHRLLMNDPVYRRGNHCQGFLVSFSGRATLPELV